MKENTKEDLGFYALMAVAIFGLLGTIAGLVVTILNALAVSGYFIVDVIR